MYKKILFTLAFITLFTTILVSTPVEARHRSSWGFGFSSGFAPVAPPVYVVARPAPVPVYVAPYQGYPVVYPAYPAVTYYDPVVVYPARPTVGFSWFSSFRR